MDFEKLNNNNQNFEIIENIEALKKGSAEAFHFLYQKYNKNVYRFCVRMLNDEDLAQDAFQETFLKVFENRTNIKGNNFAAWLYTIARHICFNILRQRKDFKNFDEFDDNLNPSSYSDETSNDDFGIKIAVDQAIAALPVNLREVILLREYEECSYNEIAHIVGIDISLAKVRVFRARVLLKKMLNSIAKEINESR
ncbi:MAG: RNA polymerase sigma factor [Candidatus Kapabacteria bacterium]|nr:RNA polymerase sigma factor [Candidatus Kapabacteria bacterium]